MSNVLNKNKEFTEIHANGIFQRARVSKMFLLLLSEQSGAEKIKKSQLRQQRERHLASGKSYVSYDYRDNNFVVDWILFIAQKNQIRMYFYFIIYAIGINSVAVEGKQES